MTRTTSPHLVSAADLQRQASLIAASQAAVEESRLLLIEADRLLRLYEVRARPLAFALADRRPERRLVGSAKPLSPSRGEAGT